MNEKVTMARKWLDQNNARAMYATQLNSFLFAATLAVFTFIKTNYLVEFLRVGLFGFQL